MAHALWILATNAMLVYCGYAVGVVNTRRKMWKEWDEMRSAQLNRDNPR